LLTAMLRACSSNSCVSASKTLSSTPSFPCKRRSAQVQDQIA
jgi:hypothetical protein